MNISGTYFLYSETRDEDKSSDLTRRFVTKNEARGSCKTDRLTDGQMLTGSDVFISDVKDGKTSGPGGGPAFRDERGLMESTRGPDIADSVGGPAYNQSQL